MDLDHPSNVIQPPEAEQIFYTSVPVFVAFTFDHAVCAEILARNGLCNTGNYWGQERKL